MFFDPTPRYLVHVDIVAPCISHPTRQSFVKLLRIERRHFAAEELQFWFCIHKEKNIISVVPLTVVMWQAFQEHTFKHAHFP
jgi:hypothetical protein